jgi:hypothetical protein
MAFTPCARANGEHAAFEYYLMTNSEGCTRGQALVLSSGRLTAAGNDTDGALAEFIAMATVEAATTSTKLVPVIRIDEMQEFEAPMGAVNSTPAPIVVGSKLQLHSDELSLSYVTTKGYFTVSGVENTGNAVVGDRVRGYFRR